MHFPPPRYNRLAFFLRSVPPSLFLVPENQIADSFRFLSRSRLINRHVDTRHEIERPRKKDRRYKSDNALRLIGSTAVLIGATLSGIMAEINKEKRLLSCFSCLGNVFFQVTDLLAQKEMEQRAWVTKAAKGELNLLTATLLIFPFLLDTFVSWNI